ncbi:hypothetical protein ACLOJK_010695 [Asimina triloba]
MFVLMPEIIHPECPFELKFSHERKYRKCCLEMEPQFPGISASDKYYISVALYSDHREVYEITVVENPLSCTHGVHGDRSVIDLVKSPRKDLMMRLSTSDLKKVALVGCPSLEKRTVFAAKNLRSFFHVQEYAVCEPCKLKSLCKYSDQTVKQHFNLNLKDALRLLAVVLHCATADNTNRRPHQLKMVGFEDLHGRGIDFKSHAEKSLLCLMPAMGLLTGTDCWSPVISILSSSSFPTYRPEQSGGPTSDRRGPILMWTLVCGAPQIPFGCEAIHTHAWSRWVSLTAQVSTEAHA